MKLYIISLMVSLTNFKLIETGQLILTGSLLMMNL